MQCITYGTMVLLMVIITFIYGKWYAKDIDLTNPKEAEKAIDNIINGAGFISLAGWGLTIWWLLGFVNDCEDGYFLNPYVTNVKTNGNTV